MLELYFIASSERKHFLFIPTDVVAQAESQSDDHVRRGIDWIERRRNRIVAWVGRALRKAHNYYMKLEDRIDPGERVLKTLAGVSELTMYYSPPADNDRAERELRRVLRRQRLKHMIWFLLDLMVSIVVVALTPILAPLPGPNVFFYYPVLRLLSHYRAIRGCSIWLRSRQIGFMCLPALAALEDNLRAPRMDARAVRAITESLNMRGLENFLKR